MSINLLSVLIDSGQHQRTQCPLLLTLPEALPTGNWQLRSEEGDLLPLQSLQGNHAATLFEDLPARSTRIYHVEPADDPVEPVARITHLPEQGRIRLALRESSVTEYHYKNVLARPYFYPLLSPEGISLTRSYPMQTDVPGETQDHPHHRSLWIAFGEVNGVDNWSEGQGHGHTEHQTLTSSDSGSVNGRFSTTSLWTDSAHNPILSQHLEVKLWATDPSIRILDFDIRLEATHGDVHFGDTKEGGILAVRVASPLDVPRGGRIENVYRGVNEGDTWGKAAHWCDYSGTIEGHPVGIAILDHPLSFRSPTHWHVRNYGLMTANPFGYAAYTNGINNGSHLLPNSQSLSFHYRLVLHHGNASDGQINSHYLNYAIPPTVRFA